MSSGSYAWIRDRDGTSGINTGPSYDHTLGRVDGEGGRTLLNVKPKYLPRHGLDSTDILY